MSAAFSSSQKKSVLGMARSTLRATRATTTSSWHPPPAPSPPSMVWRSVRWPRLGVRSCEKSSKWSGHRPENGADPQMDMLIGTIILFRWNWMELDGIGWNWGYTSYYQTHVSSQFLEHIAARHARRCLGPFRAFPVSETGDGSPPVDQQHHG